MRGGNKGRGAKKDYADTIGVAYVKDGLEGKKGTFSAINVVITEEMIANLKANAKGEIRLKGFLNVDQEDDTKSYAYLTEDDYVPKGKAANGSKSRGRAAATEDDETDFPL